MKSYWEESIEKKSFSKLDKNITTDVCVIGGGLVGLLTSYMLKSKGYDVTILEKGEVGMGVTASTTAKLTSQHGLIYNYLTKNFSKDFAKKYLRANEGGIKLAQDIINKEKIECDFEIQDAYVFTKVETELKKIKDEVEAVKELGIDVEYVDKTSLPFDVLGAIKFKNQAKFHPLKYLMGIVKSLENQGCNIYENTKVIDVDKNGERYDVITEKFKVKSKYVVIATHYPIINFPGFYFLKMYQDRTYIIAVDTKKEIFEGMYINSESPVISLRTAKYNDKYLLLAVGSGHKTGDNAADIDNAYINLENYVKSIYPDAEILYKWCTQDCITLDKVPYIGNFSSMMKNVFVATGFNKWGMTSGHVAAEIITDKISGNTNKYEDIFDSTRFGMFANKEEFGNNLKQTTKSLILSRFKIPNGKLEEIKNDNGGIINYKGKKIGVYKNKEGKVFAIKPYCAHLGCELSWNNLEKSWDCPCHGSRFDYLGNAINEPTRKNLKNIDLDKI